MFKRQLEYSEAAWSTRCRREDRATTGWGIAADRVVRLLCRAATNRRNFQAQLLCRAQPAAGRTSSRSVQLAAEGSRP